MSQTSNDEEDSSPYSITEATLQKRLKEDHGRLSSQIFASFTICLGVISFGTALGWSQIMTDVDTTNSSWKENFAWMVSVLPLGAVLGIAINFCLSQHLGPRQSMLVQSIFYIIAWWLLLISNPELRVTIRFFLGCWGITFPNTGWELIQQTLHFRVRKLLLGFYNCAVIVGVLIVLQVGRATNKFWVNVLCACIPMLQLVCLLIIKESPFYLYSASTSLARKAFAWYRGEDNVDIAMARLQKTWDFQRINNENDGYIIFSKCILKGILITGGLTVFQIMTGYFIIVFLDVSFWHSNNKSIINPLLDATIIIVNLLVFRIFWGNFHNSYLTKVRGFLISSCVLCAFTLTILTILLYLEHHSINIYVNVTWSPIFIIVVFLFFFEMGLGYYPDYLLYEYMPIQAYQKVVAINRIIYWFMVFLTILIFVIIRAHTVAHYCFALFALATWMSVLFSYFLVVEPTGKSLIQIQQELGGKPVGRRSAFYKQALM